MTLALCDFELVLRVFEALLEVLDVLKARALCVQPSAQKK